MIYRLPPLPPTPSPLFGEPFVAVQPVLFSWTDGMIAQPRAQLMQCCQQDFTHALCHHDGMPNFIPTFRGAHANFHLVYQLADVPIPTYRGAHTNLWRCPY